MISSLVDLPRKVMFGTITASGVLTILYGIIIALLLVAERRRVRTSAMLIWPLALLFGWVLLSWLWHWPSTLGFQETLSLDIFLGLIVLFAAPEERGIRRLDVGKVLGWAIAISAGLYAISLALQGPGTDLILAPRPFALFALLGVSWYVAGWVYGSWKSLLYALGLLLLIGLSLSRTAFAVGILLLPLSKLGTIRKRGLAQAGLISIVAGLFLFLAVSNIPALADRLLGNATVGEIAAGDMDLDTSGRPLAWATAFDDFTDSPWIGKGAGSAGDLLSSIHEEWGHTHNEYLRFLHDYGIIGLGLFLLGMGSLLRRCWMARNKAASEKRRIGQMRVAAFLGLAGVLLSIMTDNTASYVNVMSPLGMMVGMALLPSTDSALEAAEVRGRGPRQIHLPSPATSSFRSQMNPSTRRSV
jgi:O-antigen ligase